jgi:hypothetical protein
VTQLPPPVRRAQTRQDQPDAGSNPGFRPATKAGRKARIAIQGVSGSGKTWTGLSTAWGLTEGKRFGVIDTEKGASSLYAGERGIQYDTLQMDRYDPRLLIEALEAAAKAGYPAVVVDSLSHFWKGTDGTLDQVEKAKSKYGGNSFAGWKDGTPLQNDMVEAILTYPGHIVATMRSQTEWVLQPKRNGSGTEPVMVGMRAEQRKGIEYEFDIAAEMNIDNRLRFLKSRCPALHQQILERPDGARDIAKPVLDWLRSNPAQ